MSDIDEAERKLRRAWERLINAYEAADERGRHEIVARIVTETVLMRCAAPPKTAEQLAANLMRRIATLAAGC